MTPERTEFLALVRAARAHLEVEDELGCPALARPTPAPGYPAAPAAETSATVPGPPRTAGEPVPRAIAQGEGDKRVQLAQLAEQAAACSACVLHEKRTKNVFARGNPDAEIVFVGEGPGYEEDRSGLPFVGPAGQLLDRMIVAMGYARDEVYVCNIVKCRPPENRTPRPEEAIACSRFLIPQLDLVAPKMIVALGRCAAQNLGVAEASGPWRGRYGVYRGIPVMPTYHPAFLLRSPEHKRTVWEDLQKVMARLGKAPPSRGDR